MDEYLFKNLSEFFAGLLLGTGAGYLDSRLGVFDKSIHKSELNQLGYAAIFSFGMDAVDVGFGHLGLFSETSLAKAVQGDIGNLLGLYAGFHIGKSVDKGLSHISEKVRELYYRPEAGKRALLVQQNDDRADDIQVMNALLRERRYNRRIIRPEKATREKIIESIDQLAMESDVDSQTVFFYVGHGLLIAYPDGRTIFSGMSLNNGKTDDFNSRAITPSTLLSHLDKIHGKKAIILDGCASGDFVDYVINGCPNIISNYVLITSCPADCDSFSSPNYIKGKRIGSLTYGIYNLLRSIKGPVNISEAEILCGNKSQRANPEKLTEQLKNSRPISFEMQRAYDTAFFI